MAISVNTPISTEAHATRPAQNKRTRWTRQSLATAFLLVVLVYFILPFFWLIVSTTKTNQDLFISFGLWFASDFNFFNNLSDLFTHDGGVFLTWLWNTLYYATCSAVGASLMATLAGYAFAKFQFPGRTLVFTIILGSIMVPATALAIPTYLLLSKIGLINTPLAVILPSLASPFGVYLMRIYAEQAVPDELLDAARVDGAGEIRIFWSVALRILVPGFITVLLFSFVATWNNYFLPLLLLSDPNYYPLTLGLASWNAQASANGGAQLLYTLVLTGSLVSILPLIVAFLFLQRYWQGGLTFGSVRS
ncbi:MAG: carbohydrate ABC transporter permease [Ktedonobacteraceae bacterium]